MRTVKIEKPLPPAPYNRRASAALSAKLTNGLFDIGGALNSQTTDSQYFEIPGFTGDEGVQASFSPGPATVKTMYEFTEQIGEESRDIKDSRGSDVIDLCSSSPPKARKESYRDSRDPDSILSRLTDAKKVVAILEKELVDSIKLHLSQCPNSKTFIYAKSEPSTPLPKNKPVILSALEVVPETPQKSQKLSDSWYENGEDEDLGDPYIRSIESQLFITINRGRNGSVASDEEEEQ